jgi:hypothetical protein
MPFSQPVPAKSALVWPGNLLFKQTSDKIKNNY